MLRGLSAGDNVTAEDLEATRLRETRERMAAQRAARQAAEARGERLTPGQIRALAKEGLIQTVEGADMGYRMSSGPDDCTCGHSHEAHQGRASVASTACTIAGCGCRAYDEAPEEDDTDDGREQGNDED